eukprot:5328328-Pyramimonas_sp.AAC.1
MARARSAMETRPCCCRKKTHAHEFSRVRREQPRIIGRRAMGAQRRAFSMFDVLDGPRCIHASLAGPPSAGRGLAALGRAPAPEESPETPPKGSERDSKGSTRSIRHFDLRPMPMPRREWPLTNNPGTAAE